MGMNIWDIVRAKSIHNVLKLNRLVSLVSSTRKFLSAFLPGYYLLIDGLDSAVYLVAACDVTRADSRHSFNSDALGTFPNCSGFLELQISDFRDFLALSMMPLLA